MNSIMRPLSIGASAAFLMLCWTYAAVNVTRIAEKSYGSRASIVFCGGDR